MYAVTTNYAEVMFSHEEDALMAFYAFGHYHDLEINLQHVRYRLERDYYYEEWPLSIKFIND